MKSVLSFVAVCAIACTLAACKSDSKTSASPGAMPDCKCPEGCKDSGKCDMACCKTNSKSSMGAVSDKKDGCCAEAAKSDASMGAVGEKKDGCCSSKAKTDASLGAVSEKSSCTAVCPATGKKLN